MPIQKICAGFETTLAAKLTAGGTSFTLSSHLTKKGVELSGEYGFILGEGTATEEWLYGTISAGVVTIIKRGLDPEEPETEVTALKFDHDRGTTSVKITDYPFLGLVRKYLGGEKGLPAPLKYATHQTPSEDTELIDKKYAQELLYGAVGTASPSAAGIIFTDKDMGAKPIAKTIIAYEQATPDMTIKVSPFNIAEIDKHVNFVGGNSPIFTAPVTNPRIDILVYDIVAAALEVRAGTENASPVSPALESGDIAIAKIYHKVGETSIKNSSDGTNGYILNLYSIGVYRTDILKTSDVGTGANKIIQLDEEAKLPAVDGSKLTNISALLALGNSTINVSNSSAYTTVATVSLPANTLKTNKAVRIKVFFSDWKLNSNVGNFICDLVYGGTTIASAVIQQSSASITGRKAIIEAILYSAGTTSSQRGFIQSNFISDSNSAGVSSITSASAYGTSSEDSTSDKTLKIDCKFGTANANNAFTAVGFTIENL